MASKQPVRKIGDVVYKYRPSKAFRETTPLTEQAVHITSADFDDEGDWFISAASDNKLELYSVSDGRHTNTLFSQKYGCHLARFTHSKTAAIYASTKGDHAIRHLSTHDNAYINYFTAHTEQVTDIALCPAKDMFLSCSEDGTMQFWALNSPHPQMKLELATPYLCAWDPTGTVVAIGSPSTSAVILYDSRHLSQMPFKIFDIMQVETAHIPREPMDQIWTSLRFSNDGKSILVSTTSTGHYVLDAFSGNLKTFLERPAPLSHAELGEPYEWPRPSSSSIHCSHRKPPGMVSDTTRPLGQADACFTQDGRYVLGGSGSIHNSKLVVWDMENTSTNEHRESGLTNGHRESNDAASEGRNGGSAPINVGRALENEDKRNRCEIVVCNPRYNLIATADRDVIFWRGDEDEMDHEAKD